MNFVDNIMWGTPQKKHLPYLKDNNWNDFIEINKKKFPLNSSQKTNEELSELVMCQQEFSISDTKTKLRYKKYDIESPVILYQNFAKKVLNKNLDKQLDQITEDTKTIALHFKYYYQRPRPYQLAIYHNFKLFPQKSCSAISPSYPSGHAFQGMSLCLYLISLFPKYKNYLLKLTEDLAKSRMYIGVHFKSDNEYGFELAEKLFNHESFKNKYLK